MNNCNDFEVAIEMRLHGALARAEEEALAVHLATCANCRAFETIAKRTENVMSQQARAQLETLDWETLFSRMRTFIDRSVRTRLASGAIVLVAATSMAMLIGRHPEQIAWEALIAGAVIFGTVWVVSRVKLGHAARHQQDVGELLFLYRSELEKRLRATRRVAAMPVLIPLFFLAIRERLVSPQAWAGFVGMVCMMLGASAYVLLVRRPGIQRELDALKSELKN